MPGPGTQRRRSWLFGIVIAVLLVAAIEVSSRIYLSAATGAPFSRPADVLYAFYPELERIQSREIRRGGRDFDVLLLGASVLNKRWGTFEPAFREALELHTRHQIRIWNASAPGHSSLDSLYKYRHLDTQRFDLVLLYQAINELRANCAPDEVFRPDYSHVEWYRRVNWVERHRGLLRWTSLPYTAHDAWMEIEKLTGRYRPIPFEGVDPELRKYGRKLKTVPVFRRNVDAIATLARQRGDPLLLMTYAWYLPEGGARKHAKTREPIYTGHGVKVDAWGEPNAVGMGLAAHNAAIREVAAAHPEAFFLDEAAFLPAQREYWNDICHPTTRGMVEFADNIGHLLEERSFFQDAGRPAAAGPR